MTLVLAMEWTRELAQLAGIAYIGWRVYQDRKQAK